ncbi:type III pantothenate kinase, partial [Clostridium sp. ATCC 29733]
MLLVLNVGNTAISAGAFAGEELRFVAQTATCKGATAFDLALHIRQALALAGGGEEPFSGAVLSCVVPSLRQVAAEAAALLVRPGGRRLVLGPGVKTGLDIRTQNPAATGSDLVALAVGAMTLAGGPCAAFSLGTATAAVALGE